MYESSMNEATYMDDTNNSTKTNFPNSDPYYSGNNGRSINTFTTPPVF